MKTKVALSAFFAVTLTLSTAAGPGYSCAFSTDPCFTFTNHPDFPLKNFASGKLGILQSEYARSYLLVAYRYLAGEPLNATEQEAMVSLWDNRLSQSDFSCSTDTSEWLKLRATVPGAPKLQNIYTEKPISKDESWQTYCNCQPSSFSTAMSTLQGLITKHGIASPEVKEWLKGQDAVFSNCGQAMYSDTKVEPTMPAPLASGASEEMQKQRAYQIAAANFYAQNFETAVKEFDAIASDANSPWKNVAPYLAVRALIREASLSKELNKAKLQQASDRISRLMSDASRQDIHGDLAPLSSYVMARLSPEKYLHDLTAAPITEERASELTKTLDRVLGDDGNGAEGDINYETVPAAAKQSDMIDWIMTMQSEGDAATKHAVAQWKKTKSLPWLVAAAYSVEGAHPDANAIIAEASRNQKPEAKWALFSQVYRIKLEQKKTDEVRTALDNALRANNPDLSISGQNELKTMRLPLSRTIGDFLTYGIQRPAAVVDSGAIEGVPTDFADAEAGKQKPEQPMLTPEAGQVMNNALPLKTLKTIAETTTIPNNIRSNIAWTSWVRAILIGDDAMGRSLAPIMAPLNKKRVPLINAYLAAKTPADRNFAATFMMLKFSSARPEVTSGLLMEDDYGDASGWWWSSGSPTAGVGEKFEPLFLTAGDKAQAKAELAKLAKVPTAPTYFVKNVLERAKTNPDDPRVPEALHLAVKSTRYGATDDSTKGLSKQAFQVLHTKYKTSPWTKQTPYWY